MRFMSFATALFLSSVPTLALAEDSPLRICTAADPRTDCHARSIAQALAEARDGDRFILSRGLYEEAAVLRADGVTLSAEPGAHMRGHAAEGKAALVIKGRNTVIEGLECSEIWVPDGNGACVRMEGHTLHLRNVHFRDSQEGLLGMGGTILIEDSRFERLGGDRKIAAGQAHGIYVGPTEAFILRRSQVLASKDEGHEVKSRARRTVIEDNVIASLDGMDSRLIDIPNGGEVIIRGNVLQEGWHTSNPDLIGIGLERGRDPEIDHALNSTLIEGNTILLEHFQPTRLVHVRDVPEPTVRDNVIVGGRPYPGDSNRWFHNRAAAGLPAAPALVPWHAPEEDSSVLVTARAQSPLVLKQDDLTAVWKGQALEIRTDGFFFLRALTERPGQTMSYRQLHAELAEAGALPPPGEEESRTLVQNIGIDLRRTFRRLDPGFHALVYHPGVGFSWQE